MDETTPAGGEREQLTALLLDEHDTQRVRDALLQKVGWKRVNHEAQSKRINDGGELTIRDLAALCSVADLQAVCRRLRLPEGT